MGKLTENEKEELIKALLDDTNSMIDELESGSDVDPFW